MSAELNHPFLTDESPALLAPMGGVQGRLRAVRGADWRQTVGGAVLLLGFVLLALGWFGVSGSDRTADELSYLCAGGLGGLALIATGLTLLVAHEHRADRQAFAQLERRVGRLEEGVTAQFDALRDTIVDPASAERSLRGTLESAGRTAG
jgi:hypothetical protein